MDDMQIEPRAVKQRLDRGDKFLLVDVREPWEHEICRIEGAKLIPWARWRGAWRRWSKLKRSCSIAITESAASMQRHGCVPRASRARGRFPAGSSAGRQRSTQVCLGIRAGRQSRVASRKLRTENLAAAQSDWTI